MRMPFQDGSSISKLYCSIFSIYLGYVAGIRTHNISNLIEEDIGFKQSGGGAQ